MRIVEVIKSLLSSNPERIEDLASILSRKFEINKFLYATTEGLPITSNFENYEEIAAKVPELMKTLTEMYPTPIFSIVTEDGVYIVAKITADILLFAKGSAILSIDELSELTTVTREKLGI